MDELSLRRRVEILEEEVRELNQRLRQMEPSADTGTVNEAVAEPTKTIAAEQQIPPVIKPPPLPVQIPHPPDPAETPTRAWASKVRNPVPEEKAEQVSPAAVHSAVVEPWQEAKTIPSPIPVHETKTYSEVQIGQVWAVRIGVLLLFTGFVFLANYAWEHYISQLGALPRLLLLTLLATIGIVAGEIMRRKPRLGTFGEVITAGGLAAYYYCAFAAHHIDRLRVIEQPSLGALLLTATGMGILGYGVWRKASVMCSIALLLSFYGTSIQPVAPTAMISGLILAAAGAWLCVRYQWKSLGVVGLIGAYVAFLLWQGLLYQAPSFSLAAWFLCSYWLLYNAVVLHRKSPWNEKEAVVISSLNHGLLAAFLPFDWTQFTWDSRGWMVYGVLGVFTITIWFLLEKFRGRSRLAEAHLVQGIGLLTLATVTKWSGHELFIILAIKGIVLLGWDRWHKRISVESCGFLLLLLTIPVALCTIDENLSSSIWLLYAVLLFGGICIARREIDPAVNATPLRQIARWCLAATSLIALTMGVLQPLPEAHGALWMIGISLVLSVVARLVGKSFPAPEMVILSLSAALLAEMSLCITSPLSTDAVLLTGITLAFAHALARPQSIASWKIPTSIEVQSILLSLGAWSIASSYGLVKLPFEHWTALIAAAALVGVHALATRMKWDILCGVTPLFSIAVLLMANPLMNDVSLSLYAVYAVLLGYAAWLTLREPQNVMSAVPLLCGALGLMWQLTLESHGSIALLALPLALCLTPLRKNTLWFIVMIAYAMASFYRYIEDPSNDWLTYTVPVMWYAALGYRAQVLRKSAHTATTLIAALVTISMSLKLSEWVGWHGAGHELTILWALLAAFCFGMGFVIKERVLRLIMLLLLLASMGKILISVWQLGTLMRIASFLVTGVIFLLLGYVYNKYPEWFGKSDDTPSKEPPPA